MFPKREPCVVWNPDIRPLLVGQSTHMGLGHMKESDCIPRRDSTFKWTTSDPSIVRVTPDGQINGLSPGIFQVRAMRGPKVLEERGFVLPIGWTLRILPARATVRVGDSVTFRVVAYDASGRELPTVPYSIYTPEFNRPSSGERPLVDKWSYQHTTAPAVFRAQRVGETILTGVIGKQSVTALLAVVIPTEIRFRSPANAPNHGNPADVKPRRR
jgi:hypothetical protein